MVLDLSTYLIWALRVIFPIILFYIYFKSQSGGEGKEGTAQGGVAYSRQELLDHRAEAGPCPKPSSLSNLTMVDQTRAPSLFASETPRPARPGKGAGKGHGRRHDDGLAEFAAPRGFFTSERSEDPRDVSFRDRGLPTSAVFHDEKLERSNDTDAAGEAAGVEEVEDENMSTLALITFLAFRPGQQRSFLLEGPPPPPPRRAVAEDHSTVQVEKANIEAQSVLRGAARFGRSDVAVRLHEHLSLSQVDISMQTYSHMVDTCLTTKDLDGANHLLTKMEMAGHTPDGELVDKVMDLYSAQKPQETGQDASIVDETLDEAPLCNEQADFEPEDDTGCHQAVAKASSYGKAARWLDESDGEPGDTDVVGHDGEQQNEEPFDRSDVAESNAEAYDAKQPDPEEQEAAADGWHGWQVVNADEAHPQQAAVSPEQLSLTAPPDHAGDSGHVDTPDMADVERQVPDLPPTPEMGCLDAMDMPSPEFAQPIPFAVDGMGMLAPVEGTFIGADGLTYTMHPDMTGQPVEGAFAALGLAEPMSAAGEVSFQPFTGEYGCMGEGYATGQEYQMQQMQYCDGQGQYVIPYVAAPGAYAVGYAAAPPFAATMAAPQGLSSLQQQQHQRTKLSSKAQMFVPTSKKL
mmetsp:Transcript_29175/g.67153  ORF Transcript_29175/g.67153 Transcript_29175/m.67153 type:complete len:632 (+) Transcript_29175:95-1990(+)